MQHIFMNDCKWPLQVNILVLMWPCRNEIFLSLCIFIMLMISNSWAQLGLSKHLWPFLTNHEYMYTIGNHISAYSLSAKKVTNEIFIWFQPLRHSNFFFFKLLICLYTIHKVFYIRVSYLIKINNNKVFH